MPRPSRTPGNGARSTKPAPRRAPAARQNGAPNKTPPRGAPSRRATPTTRLLSGGNPQIAKGDGDGPVQAYIAAMPGWKGDVGRRLDALVVRLVPGVQKAVRWNSPFYGLDGQGWFLAMHCITRYVKVTFFSGASLRPPPPEPSKLKAVRYLHIFEADRDAILDGTQLAAWISQAAALPGETCF